MLSYPGLLNSLRGAEQPGCRGATHDDTHSLSGKCPQGVTGVSFNLKSSINPLYLQLHR